jgi:hypothetical protein
MPGGDRTGPMGMGPMTGRAAGYCANFGAPGYVTPGPGWACGRGAGWGRGFARGRAFARWARGRPAMPYGRRQSFAGGGPWAAWQMTREEELQYLKGQAGMLKEELDAISERVEEIESEPALGGQA